MSKNDSLLQLYARSPAPCRDYFGLTVSNNHVILNVWNISHGPHVFPKRQKVSLEDFVFDKTIQSEIAGLFGSHVLQYVLKLTKGEVNLEYLPSKVFHFILKHLASNDILRLSQTSKIFFELCNTNQAWEILFRKRTKSKPTSGDFEKAEKLAWKEILKRKIVKKATGVIKNVAVATNNNLKGQKTKNLNQNTNKNSGLGNLKSSGSLINQNNLKTSQTLLIKNTGVNNLKSTSYINQNNIKNNTVKNNSNTGVDKLKSTSFINQTNLKSTDLNKKINCIDKNTDLNKKATSLEKNTNLVFKAISGIDINTNLNTKAIEAIDKNTNINQNISRIDLNNKDNIGFEMSSSNKDLKKDFKMENMPSNKKAQHKKMQDATFVAENLIKKARENLHELSRIPGNPNPKTNKFNLVKSNAFGKINCPVPAEAQYEDLEAKIERLKTMGVLPENPKYLEKNQEVCDSLQDPHNSAFSMKSAIKNSERNSLGTKLESSTYIDLVTSFRDSNKIIEKNQFLARSAVNMQPMVREKKISTKVRQMPLKAKEYYTHMEGAKMDELSADRLKILKDMETKLRLGGKPSPQMLNQNDFSKFIGEKIAAKKVLSKPMRSKV